MSGAMIGATAGTGAAAAAAARMREEEEELTTYNKDDLDGWEFKIVRSNTGAFNKYERIRQVCEEEAKAGWEMVEKFDENRIRFKRQIDRRKNDQYLQGIDPYRTTVGMGTGTLALVVIGSLAAAITVALLVVFLIGR